MNKTSPTLLQRATERCKASSLRFAPLVLIVLLAGCEVEWGGIRVKAGEPEYEKPAALEALPDTLAGLMPLAMPAGPVLFHVRRIDPTGHATMEPVAELSGGELKNVGPQRTERAEDYAAAFVERYYQTDQAYTLFRDETRVGTFLVTSPVVSGSGICAVLRGEGQVELRPPADTLSEFLAWPVGSRAGADSLEVPGYREDMRSLSQVLARRGVTDRGIAGVWRFQAPSDFRAVRIGSGRFGFAATFMVGDSLGLGSPADSAGTAFVIADYAPAVGYFPLHFDATWYGPGGKRALRWLDSVDLLGDSEREWLLRAYGDLGSWYEVVGQQDGDTTVVWSSRRPICEAR